MTSTDTKFNEINENKVEKADRNSTALAAAIARAADGKFDEDIDCAKGLDLLKIYERFSIHTIFDLATGENKYKLYKEVFYINDPGKKYYDTVAEDKVYRRIAAQKEHGDLKWAKKVAKRLNIKIVDEGDNTTPTTEEVSE